MVVAQPAALPAEPVAAEPVAAEQPAWLPPDLTPYKPRTAFVSKPRKHPRRLLPTVINEKERLFGRALRWVLPWRLRDYPGRALGAECLFPGLRYEQIRAWGRPVCYPRGAPGWAAVALAAWIEARCHEGLEMAVELRAHAEREAAVGRKLYGMGAAKLGARRLSAEVRRR